MTATVRPRLTRFLVLGCGHTGTTLVSGILHINGYGSFNVSQLFENTSLNDLNRRMLEGAQVDESEIEAFVLAVERRAKGRWSLKDPRLSETVGRFYPHIGQPVGIIVSYRHPGATVKSLYRERELYKSHLSPQEMQLDSENEWLTRNRAILEFLDNANRSPLLIVRYDDLVDGALNETLCRFVGRPLDTSFVDPGKRHSEPSPVRQELLDVYDELNRRFEANKLEIMSTTDPVRSARRGRPTPKTRLYVAYNRVANDYRMRRDRRRNSPEQ